MKQELQERLLAAAQAVVGDADTIDSELVEVGVEVFADLQAAVKEISDDAVRELTETLRQANRQHALQLVEAEMHDLQELHVRHVLEDRPLALDEFISIWACGCGAAVNYRIKAERRKELEASLRPVEEVVDGTGR